MKKRPVICDDCGNGFKIKKIRKKKYRDGLEGDLTINYFTCPHCKKKYVTFIENVELRDMIRERKRLYSSIKHMDARTDEGQDEIQRTMRKVEVLDSRIKLRADTLKFHFSKYV